MRFISLFSGIGGFDLGFERAGMECAWQSEIDKHASGVLAHHWPHVENLGDVKNVTKEIGAVDLICGGFPCQDLSVAGRRAGLAGERSGLWFEFHRILAELQPRWVVIENVPGLLSSNKGRDMGILTGSLAQLGYWWAYRVLDSQYFGVAQRRRRVFIVGHLAERAYPAKVLFEPESSGWHPAPSREAREVSPEMVEGYDARNMNGTGAKTIPLQIKTSLNAQPSITWTIRGGGGQGGKGFLSNHDQAMTLGGQPQWIGVRRLTPLECERLQGFPDGWTEQGADGPISDTQRYKMLGNAVTVTVAEWIGRRIMERDK